MDLLGGTGCSTALGLASGGGKATDARKEGAGSSKATLSPALKIKLPSKSTESAQESSTNTGQRQVCCAKKSGKGEGFIVVRPRRTLILADLPASLRATKASISYVMMVVIIENRPN